MDKPEYDENGLCVLCHKERTEDGHDPCIANLPGVIYACCGHGVGNGYLKFSDGRCLYFKPVEMDLDIPTHELVSRVPIHTGDEHKVMNFRQKKVVMQKNLIPIQILIPVQENSSTKLQLIRRKRPS